MITHLTETGPAGTCDVCGATLTHYEGTECGVCEAVHCGNCLRAAAARGDYQADGECDEGAWRDRSTWRGCLACAGKEVTTDRTT